MDGFQTEDIQSFFFKFDNLNPKLIRLNYQILLNRQSPLNPILHHTEIRDRQWDKILRTASKNFSENASVGKIIWEWQSRQLPIPDWDPPIDPPEAP